MYKYEKLLDEAHKSNVSVDENFRFKGKTSGLYIDGNIALSDKLDTNAAKACVLAEELGHHHTSAGNILDLSDSGNRKQEHQARLWAYDHQIGLNNIIKAYEHGCRNRYEVAEYLEITEEFLEEAIIIYREKYGVCTVIGKYCIMFIPQLTVGKMF